MGWGRFNHEITHIRRDHNFGVLHNQNDLVGDIMMENA